MSFRKFQADYLFTGKEILPPNHVLVCNERGVVERIIDQRDAGDDIQKLKGVLSPGLINCHCHLELSHMRGLIPEKTGLVDFVFSVVTQRHFPDEEIMEAISKAEDEMLENGIVAVGDISNNVLTLQQKQLQRLRYYNFVEASGWLPAIAPQRFQRSFENYSIFSKVAPSALVPHAPYSVSDELWQLIMPFYQNRVVTIHNQETVFEDELFVQNTGDFVRMYEMMKLDSSFYTPSGKSSLQTYFANLSGAASVLLVHNTFTKEADIDFVQLQTNGGSVSFCLCANANKFIEQAVPPVELLRQKQCHIVLGTDSLASNWSLNLVDEMKTIQNSFPNVPVEELLTWVTFNGAKALQMEDSLGSFEQGKQPGVVLLQHLDLADESTLQSTIPKRVF